MTGPRPGYVVQREGNSCWHDIGFSRTSTGAQDIFTRYRVDYPGAVLRIVPMLRDEIDRFLREAQS